MRAILTSSKPEENPPTSNAAQYHILRAMIQPSRWQYAHLSKHSIHVSASNCGGYYTNDAGKLCPVMMTFEPMPTIIEDIVTIGM